MLLKKQNNRYFLEMHPHLLKASKLFLKASIRLLQARSGKFIFLRTRNKYTKILCHDHSEEKFDHFLISKCMKTSKCIYIAKGEKILDADKKLLGISNFSYMISPLSIGTKGNGSNIGVLYFKDKLTNSKFTYHDHLLVRDIGNTFLRLLYNAKVNSHLILDFTSALLILIENTYLNKSSSDNSLLTNQIIKISKMLNSILSLQSLLEIIMESAKLVLKSESSSLMLIDKKKNELYFNIVAGGKEHILKEIRIPIGQGIAGLVVRNRKPLIVNRAQEDDRVYKKVDEKAEFETRNLIAVPMIFQNKAIGVIEVINSIDRKNFSEKDLKLLSTFAEQAALAIKNRELIDSLKETNMNLNKKVNELSSLHKLGKALISTLNEKELFELVVKIIADELQVKRVSIMLNYPSDNSLKVVSQIGLPAIIKYSSVANDSLSRKIYHKNKSFYTNDLEKTKFAEYRDAMRYNTGACIIQTLYDRGKNYGLINISDKIDGHPFTEDDYQLVVIIANQITKSIQNFRLLEEMLKKKSYEKELEITSSFQKSILPSKDINSDKFDLSVVCIPAKMMGGDFYDFFKLKENKYVFLIADVAGKGLPASLFMAISSSIIRSITKIHSSSISKVLHHSNNLIYEKSRAGMFVTLFYAIYEEDSRKFTFSSAGHDEQLLYKNDTDDFELLHSKGRALGLLPSERNEKFYSNSVQLKPGDIIIFYTDGIVEAINSKKEQFGLERLKDIVSEKRFSEAKQIAKEIHRQVNIFSGDTEQFDDFTLMVLKILN